MYHYRVINKFNHNVVFDSTRMEQFDGWDTEQKAEHQGIDRITENDLVRDHHIVEVFESNQMLEEAFSTLMGINGNQFVNEIISTGKLSANSYEAICNNIKFNSKESIVNHFGIVHYYYLQNK